MASYRVEMGRGGRAPMWRVSRSILATLSRSILGIRRTRLSVIVPWPAKATFSVLRTCSMTWIQNKKSYLNYFWLRSFPLKYFSMHHQIKIKNTGVPVINAYLTPLSGVRAERRDHRLSVIASDDKQSVSGTEVIKGRKICICSG